MKMHIDTGSCEGHGLCEGIRPDIFQVGDDGIVHLLTEDFTGADRQDLDDAVYQCPAQALRLEGPARTVTPGEIFRAPCDVFAPCALGGIISSTTIGQLQCRSSPEQPTTSSPHPATGWPYTTPASCTLPTSSSTRAG